MDLDFEEFVKERGDALFEDIKDRIGPRWDELRDKYEEDVKAVAQYIAAYTYKSIAGREVDPHLAVLEAIAADFVAIGQIQAQDLIDTIIDAVKDHAKEFVKVLASAAARAGIDALKELSD